MDSSVEVWKTSSVFAKYEVSNFGNIRHKGAIYSKCTVPKHIGSEGMVYVTLRDNESKKKFIPLCKIVASEFVPNNNGGETLTFIDGNKSNCCCKNLKWDDCLEYEEWRQIKGYEGLYEISNKGRVRSISRSVPVGSSFAFRNARIRKLNKKQNGYYGLLLSKNHKNKNFLVHRLVADAFLPNPNDFPQINHKNEDKSDNRVENLEWCTEKYNSNYGTRMDRIRKNNPKLKGKRVLCIDSFGKIINSYESIQSVKKDGHNPALVHMCCVGSRHKHHGYIWKFK